MPEVKQTNSEKLGVHQSLRKPGAIQRALDCPVSIQSRVDGLEFTKKAHAQN